MDSAAQCPADLRLVLHQSLPDGYEMSQVLLARASGDGTLQLLASGWERLLGYRRGEFDGRTLLQLMWSNRRSTAAAVAAILDQRDMAPVEVRIRCRDGRAKSLRLHRRYEEPERLMYIVAEEIAAGAPRAMRGGEERRFTVRAP